MLNQPTIEKLHAMKLPGMAEALKDQLPQPDRQRLSFEERFGLIVDRQWDLKENNHLQRYLKEAKPKRAACVEDSDYQAPRGIDQSVIMRLISCDRIRHHQNIITTGPTGAGKTFSPAPRPTRHAGKDAGPSTSATPSATKSSLFPEGMAAMENSSTSLPEPQSFSSMIWGLPPRRIRKGEPLGRSLKSDTETDQRSSQVNFRSKTGMSISGILPSPMPSLTLRSTASRKLI